MFMFVWFVKEENKKSSSLMERNFTLKLKWYAEKKETQKKPGDLKTWH